jgi:hypothetical protein
VFRLDDMSVVEWLTTTRWELEMSADDRETRGLATRTAYGCPRRGIESTTCEELAWSLIEQAMRELQLELYGRGVTYAA